MESSSALELIAAAFEAAREGLLIISDRQVLLANAEAARLLGCENQGSLTGQSVDQFFAHAKFCGEVLREGSTVECSNPICEWKITRGDSDVVLAVRCTRFRNHGRAVVLASLHEKNRSEMRRIMDENDTRFRAIFEGSEIGIGTCTLDGRILDGNPALARISGYSREELVGMHARELHPGDLGDQEAALLALARGESDSCRMERNFRRKDGSVIPAYMTVSLVRDPSSQPAFIVAMVEDMTERKRLEDQLRESEKLEVIGRLAGGIAHDFNNLLTGVRLYCDLALSALPPIHNARPHAEQIRLACEQGTALTQQLLSVARKQPARRSPVDINEIVGSTENLLRRLIGEHVRLVIDLGSGLEKLVADAGQLRQVLLNLALNARDSLPENGQITIATRMRRETSQAPRSVSLEVMDNGCGMDAETQSRMFQPFFTTKKAGKGTGLGLATVKRIVEESNGRIEVSSIPGSGTRVEILFPAYNSSDSDAPAHANDSPTADDRNSVLEISGAKPSPANPVIQQVLVVPHPKGEVQC